jgi:hypothetical protein
MVCCCFCFIGLFCRTFCKCKLKPQLNAFLHVFTFNLTSLVNHNGLCFFNTLRGVSFQRTERSPPNAAPPWTANSFSDGHGTAPVLCKPKVQTAARHCPLISAKSIHELNVHYPCWRLSHNNHHNRRKSPPTAKAFLSCLSQISRFKATLFQFCVPMALLSSSTASSHVIFGLPLPLVPHGLPKRILLAGVSSSILITYPAHLIRPNFMNLTVSSSF